MAGKSMIPLAIWLTIVLAAPIRMAQSQSPRGQRGAGNRSDQGQRLVASQESPVLWPFSESMRLLSCWLNGRQSRRT